MAFEVDEDCFCMTCWSPVLWGRAETSDDDYLWRCSNDSCPHGAIPDSASDMDVPDWIVDRDELTTARETDPQTILDTLDKHITQEQEKIQTLTQASASTRARYQDLLLTYESRMRQLAVQRQIFAEVVAEGRPWNYPAILLWQKHRFDRQS
jgi:hypothetical protein